MLLAKIISDIWAASKTTVFEVFLSVGQAGLEPTVILPVLGLQAGSPYPSRSSVARA